MMSTRIKTVETQGYDLIGDIHGEADQLKSLLERLGYRWTKGVLRHPAGRQAIFLGDLIDRGPKVYETLALVKAMVDTAAALMVLGNHEFNFLCMKTPNGSGGFLRKQSDHNLNVSRMTLEAFEGKHTELCEYLEWFRTIPLCLDLGRIRVVHAEWNDELVAEVNGRSRLTDDFLREAVTKGSRPHLIIETLLKGTEARLPAPFTVLANDGKERDMARVRWPVAAAGSSWREITFAPDVASVDAAFLESQVPKDLGRRILGYGANNPPVFFGHYAVEGRPNGRITPNAACLDYGCGKREGARLAAYRWSGEEKLLPANFFTA